jgi:hypothetical protein
VSEHSVVLVYSTSHALRLEKALKAESIESRLVPVPRQLSSDCGVCVRVARSERERVSAVLKAIGMDTQGTYDL